jgi:hypothetical protein
MLKFRHLLNDHRQQALVESCFRNLDGCIVVIKVGDVVGIVTKGMC